jgi:hypothetical protein
MGRSPWPAKAAADAAGGATDIERALIGALTERYPSSPSEEDFGPWHDAYADAMRAVHKAYSDDLNVCTLFAEALMNRTPWQLWDLATGKPAQGASTTEAIAVLEGAFQLLDGEGANRHPGLLHMYIHLMEMSPHPERALKAGDALVDLVPDELRSRVGPILQSLVRRELIAPDHSASFGEFTDCQFACFAW